MIGGPDDDDFEWFRNFLDQPPPQPNPEPAKSKRTDRSAADSDAWIIVMIALCGISSILALFVLVEVARVLWSILRYVVPGGVE